MKFDLHDCWKHKNCMDVFFFINTCYPYDLATGSGNYIVTGYWVIQGMEHYWLASDQDRIIITKDQYDNWQRYEPKGKFI